MNRILITGATGFVGQNLIPYLQQHGYSDIIPQSVRYGDAMPSLDNIDTVIHLAGKAHDTKHASAPEEYYQANHELSKQLYDAFLGSEAGTFIFVSSVKAAADTVETELDENTPPDPQTAYGKSKLMAEQYMLRHLPGNGRRLYVIRPCMIHGPGNKGNLNLLYEVISRGIPWPLGAFDNKRSFCNIDNFCFVVRELIERIGIPSGIYNVSDDTPVATNMLIRIIGENLEKKPRVLRIPKQFIRVMAILGDYLPFPLNSERLKKLTESYVVSNKKLVQALGRQLPFSSHEGLKKTILSFKNAK